MIERSQLDLAALAAVEQPAVVPMVNDAESVWVVAPLSKHVHEEHPSYAPRFNAVQRDYPARESRNRSLGLAGELLVADLEARRLRDAGHNTLINRVDHVAKSKGDGLGYDVLSFDENGRERFIEVKATAFGVQTRSTSVAMKWHVRKQTQTNSICTGCSSFANSPGSLICRG